MTRQETFQALQAIIQRGGTMAQRLLATNMSVDALRTNLTLRKDEWKHYDKAVVKIARERLVGVADLYSAGLVYKIGNGLGKTVLEYEDSSDIEAAQVSMDGETVGRNDRVEFDLNYLPLPMTHKDWKLSIRVLNASRETGDALDTTQAEAAARKVSEKIEEYLFVGSSSYTFGGGTIYGLTDQTNRNTGSLTANWDDSAANGETILDDVLAMKQACIDAKHYGPYRMYIPTNYDTVMDDDFKSNSDKSIMTRLNEVEGLQGVKVADKLTDDNVVLVQYTSDVIRLVEGLPITNLEWQEQGGMVTRYKVMAIVVPQIRADQDGNSGVAHWS